MAKETYIYMAKETCIYIYGKRDLIISSHQQGASQEKSDIEPMIKISLT